MMSMKKEENTLQDWKWLTSFSATTPSFPSFTTRVSSSPSKCLYSQRFRRKFCMMTSSRMWLMLSSFLLFILSTLNGATHHQVMAAKGSQCPLQAIIWNRTEDLCPGADLSLEDDKIDIIGYLGSFSIMRQGLGVFMGGAIPLAVEAVNRDPNLLPGRTLCYMIDDTGDPDTSAAMRAMSQMRDMGVKAFVGLEHSCAQEAMLAAAWDIPLVSYKCADVKVSNKTLYTTFARTLPPSSKVSKSLISTLVHFNWRKVVLVLENTTADYRQIEEAFLNDLKKLNNHETSLSPSSSSLESSSSSSLHSNPVENVASVAEDAVEGVAGLFSDIASDGKEGHHAERQLEIIETYHVPADYLSKDIDLLGKIVDETKDHARIYVTLTDIFTAVDLARVLHEKHLADKGEYIVLAVDKDEVYDPERYDQFCSGGFTSFRNSSVYTNACRSMLVLAPSSPENKDFYKAVNERTRKAPINAPQHHLIDPTMPIYAALAYDAVKLLAKAMTEVYEEGGEAPFGSQVIQKMIGQQYTSILGLQQELDENGDAGGSYTLFSLPDVNDDTLEGGNMTRRETTPVANFINNCRGGAYSFCLPSFSPIKGSKGIQWIGKQVPVDEPECGFTGEKCKTEKNWKQVTLIVACCSLMTIALGFIIRHYRYEQKLACLLWKVDVRDIILPRTNSEYTLQNLRSTINFQGIDLARIASFKPSSGSHHANNNNSGNGLASGGGTASGSVTVLDMERGPISSGIGFYRGNVVFIKRIHKKSIDLTRDIRKELIRVREMRHENINPFIGASVDSGNVCILSLYCARGSLEDVLRNEDLDLDMMFVASLVADLIKGMIYLHDSSIASHGNLKSSNCLVDSRWVLQIADFGLHEFRANQDETLDYLEKKRRSQLWKAPELLRHPNPPLRGTQKGDVYSFAIILYEIIGRKGPWGLDPPEVEEIVDQVCHPELYGGRICRPPLNQLSCPAYVFRCMEDCWQEDPEGRPDFRFINIRLREMQTGLKPNIFDNMIAILEKHAYNLEAQVKERTEQLLSEKKKTEMLLLRMLPKTVAEQLKRGEFVDPEYFESVTIYFSDIVGFTEISATSTPLQVVDLLNDLYSCFDSIIEHYQVYKVETIGDAYMVVSGLPKRNGDEHAGHVASMALHLLSEIQTFEIRHRPGERLKLRIGIHSGPCVAGVVGHKMPRYCLFGDTVNTASRTESSGEALKIHVSEATKVLLDKLGGYILKERGLTAIKGKGVMKTHWLIGKARTPSGKEPVGNSSGTIVSTSETMMSPSFTSSTTPFTTLISETNSDGSGRVAKVRPYSFFSSEHLSSSLANNFAVNNQQVRSGNNIFGKCLITSSPGIVGKRGSSDYRGLRRQQQQPQQVTHRQITRTFSLGEQTGEDNKLSKENMKETAVHTYTNNLFVGDDIDDEDIPRQGTDDNGIALNSLSSQQDKKDNISTTNNVTCYENLTNGLGDETSELNIINSGTNDNHNIPNGKEILIEKAYTKKSIMSCPKSINSGTGMCHTPKNHNEQGSEVVRKISHFGLCPHSVGNGLVVEAPHRNHNYPNLSHHHHHDRKLGQIMSETGGQNGILLHE